jgi:integrase
MRLKSNSSLAKTTVSGLLLRDEQKYLEKAAPLLHNVATVLLDTGMRPEECHHLTWENLNWDARRNGTIMITRGKTKAARRLLPMTPRVRAILEFRWEAAGEPGAGWVWPANTRSGHMEHDTLRVQHKNALAASKVRPFVIYSFRHTFLTRLAGIRLRRLDLGAHRGALEYRNFSAVCSSLGGCGFVGNVEARWAQNWAH